MNKKALFFRSVIAAAITASSASAVAAGFQINGQSATGLGRAFSGDAVIADNASVMARNPAAMSLFERPEISLGMISIKADVDVLNGRYTGPNQFGRPTSYTFGREAIGDISYVPNLFYVHPLTANLTLGAGVYSNFGTKTEFSDSFIANEFGGLTDLKTVNFGLSAAYKISDHLSLGLGVDLITGTGKLKRHNPNFNIPNILPTLGNQLLDVDAEGTGVGANVGVVYQINDNHRFGLSYRYSPDIKASGKIIHKAQQLPGELVLKLPDIAEFSGFHQLHEKIAVHYSIQYIGWSTFDTLTTTENTELNDYHWKDGWHYSLGMTYDWNDKFSVRGGYMFDTSAQNKDKSTSISVPDSNRQWISGGFSYYLSDQSTIDFGLTYLFGENVDVTENTYLDDNDTIRLSQISAMTHADAFMYGLQYTYKF